MKQATQFQSSYRGQTDYLAVVAWLNHKQTKYQQAMEEKLTTYKIINKYRPEPAQVDIPNPKSKTK